MRKKVSTILLFSAAFLLAAALPVLPSLLDNTGFYGMALDEPGTAIGDYRPPEEGIAIVFFGYQQCGTVCPVQSVNLMELGERLKGEKVEFLFVTLDPENDTEDTLVRTVQSMGEAFTAYRPDSFTAAQNWLQFTTILPLNRQTELKTSLPTVQTCMWSQETSEENWFTPRQI